MRKVGRNDPCPCGSGKKYKRCCNHKDSDNKVTRIVPDQRNDRSKEVINPSDYDDLCFLLEEKLSWSNELYRILARHLMKNMVSDNYDWEQVSSAIILWNSYSNHVQPLTRKAGVLPAAIEYSIANIWGLELTLGDLAAKYKVSAGTISKRAREILEFAENNTDQIPRSQSSNPRMAMEQELYQLEKLLQDQSFDSLDQANEFLSKMINRPSGLENSRPSSKKDQATQLLFKAAEHPSPRERVKLAQKALQIYPDSPDAFNILAENQANSLEEIMDYYKKGMTAGIRDLGKRFFEENKGHFWGIIDTRPFMRAKLGYAECLFAAGSAEEAILQFQELLELNPNDNQGVRYPLLTAYIESKQYTKALELIHSYQEKSANFLYNQILIEYATHGLTQRLDTFYKNAVNQNPFVMDYLLEKKKLPNDYPEYLDYGGKNEAITYVQDHLRFWRKHLKLMSWLKEKSTHLLT